MLNFSAYRYAAAGGGCAGADSPLTSVIARILRAWHRPRFRRICQWEATGSPLRVDAPSPGRLFKRQMFFPHVLLQWSSAMGHAWLAAHHPPGGVDCLHVAGDRTPGPSMRASICWRSPQRRMDWGQNCAVRTRNKPNAAIFWCNARPLMITVRRRTHTDGWIGGNDVLPSRISPGLA